nr:olfactory receptor 6B1-like [Pogona vitticeps]
MAGGRNQTTTTEFILIGFGDTKEFHILFSFIFLAIYLSTTMGNILIIALIITNNNLHTPMYFFLGNLACLEICYISTIVPKLITIFLTGDGAISFWGCIVQFYFFAALAATECTLLAVMSHDRYLAICKPLHYGTLMNIRVCIVRAAGCWLSGFPVLLIVLHLMSRLPFCGSNMIQHFFCDLAPVISISCGETQAVEFTLFSIAFTLILPPFLLTAISYVFIILAVLRIPSTTGRKKAFSTCSSHLIVVSMFYGSLAVVYLLPRIETLRKFHKIFSVFYTVITPLINPLIYTLRNREFKEALKKLIQKLLHNTF